MKKMTRSEIVEKVNGCIVAITGEDQPRDMEELRLKEDLELDSLDALELIMSICTAFDIDITDEETEHIRTVADVVNIVEQKLEEKR